MIVNPYVGPRAFEEEDSDHFYGREEETRQLASLVIARRAVLLYAQSGAGKTSLIQAGLIPRLRTQKRIVTLRVGRVGGQLAQRVDGASVGNIYVFNLLIDLHGPAARPEELAGQRLRDGIQPFLQPQPDEPRLRPRLLILDQFEEIFTTHHERFAERSDFFRQVHDTLTAYPQLSILLAMREDYIAQLDPHVSQLPDRLRTRFRLERLQAAAALAAIVKPTAGTQRTYAPGVAEALVANLQGVPLLQPGQEISVNRAADAHGVDALSLPDYAPDNDIEPVHLQIVCHQLWESLPPERTTILAEDLKKFGDVDRALTGFYEQALSVAMTQTGLPERRLREWVQSHLITPARRRGLVYRDTTTTGGLDNATVDILNNAYIIRANVRSVDDIWYELAHDRLLEPVLASNEQWRTSYEDFNPLPRAVRLWEQSGRTPDKLLQGAPLTQAKRFAQSHPLDLTESERDFLAQSMRQQQRRHIAIGASLLVMVVLALLTIWALDQRNQANARELALAAIANLDDDPELSILLALDSLNITHTTEGEDALHQSVQASRIEQRLGAHEGQVRAVAFTLDGARLVTAGEDGDLNVWDRASGALLQTITAHPAAINALAISPDGSRLASVSDDGAANIWSYTGETLAAEPLVRLVHGAKIRSVAFAADGQQLATGGDDAAVLLWNLTTSEPDEEPQVLPDPEGMVINAVAFSPDGTTLVAGRPDGTLVAWDLASRTAFPLPNSHEGPIYALAFSPNGASLAVGGWDGARIWDTANFTVIHTLAGHASGVLAVTYSADGQRLATAGEDLRVKVWESASGSEVLTLAGHKGWVQGVSFSPDGAQLATASIDGTARLWRITESYGLSTLAGHDAPVLNLRFSPDGEQITTLDENGTVTEWEISTGQVMITSTLHAAGEFPASSFTGDGRLITSINGVHTVWELDEASGTISPTVALQLFDDETQQRIAVTNRGSTLLATAGTSNAIKLWDLTTGQLATTLLLADSAALINGMVFSPDSALLVVAQANGVVAAWDVAQASQIWSRTDHTSDIWKVTFSRDGRLVATAGRDSTARIWDAATGEPRQILRGHSAPVLAVLFSPDGQRLVTGSRDKTARIWDVASGRLLLTLTGHSAEVWSLVFSPDGSRLATASNSTTVHLYTLDIDQLSAEAHARLTRGLQPDECRQYLRRERCD